MLDGWKDLRPFKAWCIQVLPTIFDESMSYYECLCKMVKLLNDTMNNVDLLHEAYNNFTDTINTSISEFKNIINSKVEELENFMRNYFNNLDVQEEINQKLDDMVEEGTISRLLTSIVGKQGIPIFVTSTSQMTNKNTIYVLISSGHIYQYNGSSFYDTGLSYITGANAVYASNILIDDLNYQSYNDANNYEPNKIYAFSENLTQKIAHLPTTESGILYSLSYSATARNGIIQVFMTRVHGKIFWREKYASSWRAWIEITGSGYVLANNTYQNYVDDNSVKGLPPDSTYFIRSNITPEMLTDLPAYGHNAVIETLSFLRGCEVKNTSTMQRLFTNGTVYYRLRWNASVEYSNWFKINTDVGDRNVNDFNLLKENTITYINTGDKLNSPPVPDNYMVFTIGALNVANIQIALSSSFMFARYNFSKWTKWIQIGSGLSQVNYADSTPIEEIYNDANNFPISYITSAVSSNEFIANQPSYNSRLLIQTIKTQYGSKSGTMQFAYDWYLGSLYIRANWASKWSKWTCLTSNGYYCNTCIRWKARITENSKVLTYGDSIFTNVSADGLIPQMIQEAVGCQVTNHARAGARISSTNKNNIQAQADATPISEIQNANLVICNAGINDIRNNVSFSDIISGIDYFANKLKSAKSDIEIVWLTPIPSDRGGELGILQYSGIICYHALKNGMSVIDGSKCPVAMQRQGMWEEMPALTTDGLHPNPAGKQIVTNYILTHLR